jgi:hypothetical protein
MVRIHVNGPVDEAEPASAAGVIAQLLDRKSRDERRPEIEVVSLDQSRIRECRTAALDHLDRQCV